MKKIYKLIAMLLATLSLAAQCEAILTPQPIPEISPPDISIEAPFARASRPNGAIYLNLVNKGGTGDVLLSAETDVAQATELHETKMDDNEVMRMSPISRIEVPAGGSTTLEPGGKHIMLIGLDEKMTVADIIDLTLNFERSGPITLQVEVQEGMMMADDDQIDSEHSLDMNNQMEHK